MDMHPRRQGGFALIELVVVAIVIGALVASMLGVEAVRERALAKTLLREMYDVRHMYMSYVERYRKVPGASDPDEPAYISGSWTGPRSLHGDHGLSLFWQRLREAGIAPGDPLATAHRPNAVKGHLGVTSNGKHPIRPAGVAGAQVMCTSLVGGHLARMMDHEADDGDATTGKMWAAAEDDGSPVITAVAPSAYKDDSSYTVCMPV
jgi:type II secretory pathway pseudopilin PulG